MRARVVKRVGIPCVSEQFDPCTFFDTTQFERYSHLHGLSPRRRLIILCAVALASYDVEHQLASYVEQFLRGDECSSTCVTALLVLYTKGVTISPDLLRRQTGGPRFVSSRPMLAPLVIIESATYGQTREGIDDRLQRVQRDLSDLLSLQNRKDMGMPTSRDDNIRLLHLRPRIAELG